MKITFSSQSVTEKEIQHTERKQVSEGNTGSIYTKKACFAERAGTPFDVPVIQGEKGKSLLELQQEASNTNVAVQQDYMTLMSNTMSEEDYARLQEEGFDFGNMEPEEAVTIVDKIKAELVRAGKQVAGYTDDLDMDTLSAALGSQVLAQAVADSFRSADIPLTEENVTAVKKAWNMASQLQPLEDGSTAYLIDNEMEGEIWNLYLAQSSGAGRLGGNVPRFYAEDVRGYYARSADMNESEELPAQIDRLLEQCGREVNVQNRQHAAWLVEKGLLLTQENLSRLEELEKIQLPMTEEVFANSTSAAVAEGKDPVHGRLSGDGESLYQKAVRLESYYRSDEVWEASAENITARRQLEEVRLRMTAEVNVRLLKSGFSIDTAPMEELVEALKTAEQELADSYFPEDAQAVLKYRAYCETNRVMEEIPGLPASVLGTYAEGQTAAEFREVHGSEAQRASLGAFFKNGKGMQAAYEKAGESYEALMTAPRKDMGDSIRKAFANVDDILSDLGQELTEENRRAARILGYNRMDMTVENLEAVREADRQVKTAIGKLTPAAVLKMIRDGVNPLEKSFGELEEYFDSLPEEYREESEKFSRFLYGLEQNSGISAEERETYIGIYRLVRQIEKSDGAAIGALVNTQAELHFSNLLSAVRTGKFKSMDVRVSDETAVMSELVRKGESIPEQIARAFADKANELLTEVSYSEEANGELQQMQLKQYRAAVLDASGDTTAMLNRGQLPASAENLLAAEALAQETDNLLAAADRRKAENTDTGRNGKAAVSTKLWEKLEEKQEFMEEYQEITETAGNAVEEITLEQSDTSLDVRRMQLVHKQLTIMSSLASAEEYFLPMYVGEVLTRVHLTLNKGGEKTGNVRIDVPISEKGHLTAQFSLEKGHLRGIFSAEAPEEVMKLEEIADIFKEEAENNWFVESIAIVSTTVPVPREDAENVGDEKVDNRELYRVAKVFLHAVQQGVNKDENQL